MITGGNVDAITSAKKKKNCATSCCVFSLVLMAVLVGAAFIYSWTAGKNSKYAKADEDTSHNISASVKAIQALCQPTSYKETCINSLTSAAGNTSDTKELIKVEFQVAIDALKKAMKNSTMLKELAKDSRTNQALDDCHELMDSSIDDLKNSIHRMSAVYDLRKLEYDLQHLRILLSGALTFENSCLDEFENITGDVGEKMKRVLNASMELTNNGLDMITQVSSYFSSVESNNKNRKLLFEESEVGFPTWVHERRRKLVDETPSTINPNVTVAKDGSGKYLTINEALNDVPKNNNNTFVIYIKAGIYQEYVVVQKHMTNVMFIGDGPYKTKITGNKNLVDGTRTMKTATVAILGANFMGKDIGFENTAGAIKHQAVALRVQSDMSIFYNCLMDGYQDTLYAHAHAQFYRECTIAGTVDFIFGNAAAVFQNCKIVIKKPLQNQQCITTAQGRTVMNEATGFVLQNCTVTGEPAYWAVKDVNKGYLGRPWKEYSRTIVMQSQIDDVIQPEGWLPWNGEFALNTLWYAEYGNRGPGSVRTQRVKWSGIKELTDTRVFDFTVEKFIGDNWIKNTGVPYTPGMMNV